MIRAGPMRFQVVIERRTDEQDDAGQQLDEWDVFATRRAAMQRVTGDEIETAQQEAARVPTTFRLRWLDGVLPAMRLTCDGKVYDIKSAVDPDGLKNELIITAAELVGGGAA